MKKDISDGMMESGDNEEFASFMNDYKVTQQLTSPKFADLSTMEDTINDTMMSNFQDEAIVSSFSGNEEVAQGSVSEVIADIPQINIATNYPDDQEDSSISDGDDNAEEKSAVSKNEEIIEDLASGITDASPHDVGETENDCQNDASDDDADGNSTEEVALGDASNDGENNDAKDDEGDGNTRNEMGLDDSSNDSDSHEDGTNSAVMAALNIMAFGEGGDRNDQILQEEDGRGWEEIAYGREAENQKPQDKKEERNLLRGVARWWNKTGSKAPEENTHQNEAPKGHQPLPTKDATITPNAIQASESTKDNGGDSNRNTPARAPRWWWRGRNGKDTATGQHKDEDAPEVGATSHTSDAEASIDYNEIGTELLGSALDWLRKDEIVVEDLDHESVSSDISSLGDDGDDHDDVVGDSPSSIRRSPEQRSADLEKVVQWMRKGKGKGKNKEDKYDPTREFRKLDDMLPRRNGMTPEERAIEIENSLDWLRKYYSEELPAQEDTSKTTTPADTIDWNKLGPAPVCLTNPDDRLSELENVMMWMRNKGLGMGSKYDPHGTFRKLHKLLPRKKGHTPEDRGREIEGVLDWMRNSELIALNATEITLPEEVDKLEKIRISRRTPEQRANDLKAVRRWMSHGGGHGDDETMDPAGHFRRLNMLLEAKENQSIEDRAREIECSLDWFLHSEFDGLVTSSPGGRQRRNPRGGRRMKRRTPSPGKKKSGQVRVPKLVTSPREAQPNILASIGRVINVVAPPPSDISTTGVTTLTDPNDVLLDIAQQHTTEMVKAIALLVEPETPPAEATKEAETDIFCDTNENWWESEDSVIASDA